MTKAEAHLVLQVLSEFQPDHLFINGTHVADCDGCELQRRIGRAKAVIREEMKPDLHDPEAA